MTLRIIGIDLGVTASHTAAILDPAISKALVKRYRFRTKAKELDRLLVRARRDATDPVKVVVVLEATSMSWYPVGLYLDRCGAQVYRVTGRQTKDLRKVHAPHAHSDTIDGEVLARLYLTAPDKLHLWTPPTGDQLALQRLCREVARLRSEDVAIQNRLNSYDYWAWTGLHKIVPAQALAWMRRHWYDPWQVSQAGVGLLRQAWIDAGFAVSAEDNWFEKWVTRAEEVVTLYGSRCWVGYESLQQSIIRALDRQVEIQGQRKALVAQHIQPLFQQLYPDCPLESIPGIGADSAATYMAFIHSIDRFPNVQKFKKWCGMVPRSFNSGTVQSKGLGITQAGPNLVKATLYQNAEVARQRDVQMARIYYTQMVAYGKHHTQAVCACASHLASRIYSVLTQQRPYELRDPSGQSISKQQSRQLILDHFTVPEEIRKRTRIHSQTN